MKVVLTYVMRVDGPTYAVTIGTTRMLKWCVACLDTRWKVNTRTVFIYSIDHYYHTFSDGNSLGRFRPSSDYVDLSRTQLGKLDCEGTEETIIQCPSNRDYHCLKSGAAVICPSINGIAIAVTSLLLKCKVHMHFFRYSIRMQ